ncbi:hypothetical protein ACP4OV_007357 [Aristida adscensionis]
MEQEKGAATAEEKGKAAAGAVRMITLSSADGTEFEVSEAAARLLKFADFSDDGITTDGAVMGPLPYATTGALAMAVSYCETHAAAAKPDSDHAAAAAGSSSSSAADSNNNNALASQALKDFDRGLVRQLSPGDLGDLLLAAHYLHIDGLIAVAAQEAADRIKGKTAAQLRQVFNLPNDTTAQEEQAIRDEYQWGLDG